MPKTSHNAHFPPKKSRVVSQVLCHGCGNRSPFFWCLKPMKSPLLTAKSHQKSQFLMVILRNSHEIPSFLMLPSHHLFHHFSWGKNPSFFIIFHGKKPMGKARHHWSQVTLDAGSFLLLPYCLGSGPVAITGGPEACHPAILPWHPVGIS